MPLHSKKILVTGGAGFIGSHIVDAYVLDGHEVVIIDNLSTGKRENINSKAKFYEMDICEPEVKNLIRDEKPDVINHHAAQIDVRKSVADPLFDLKVNQGGLINLLEACRNLNLQKIIFASSGGTVYGEQHTFPATESHSLNPISPYGLNKLGGEQYLYYFKQSTGVPFIALRYANIYGPRQNHLGEAGVVSIFAHKLLVGEQALINGDGKQTRDYVFIDDVVEINKLALENDMRGAYNVGTEIETDVNEIYQLIKNQINPEAKEQHGIAKKGEQRRSCLTPQRVLKELSWRPQTTIEQGIEQTVKWFKENLQY